MRSGGQAALGVMDSPAARPLGLQDPQQSRDRGLRVTFKGNPRNGPGSGVAAGAANAP